MGIPRKQGPPGRRGKDRAIDRGAPRPGRATASRDAGLGLGVRLVHEDDELLVVDKPPGLVTAPAPGAAAALHAGTPSVFAVVKQYVRRKRRRGGRAWIIHRLDKEASGLLVFAKTERAFEWLKEDFRSRRVQRLYLAVVEGEFAESARSGTIQSFVEENPSGLMTSVSAGAGTVRRGGDHRSERGPQLAVTHYRVVESAPGLSLLQLRLATGRKNQIRVHMSEAGHPLIGDYRYRPQRRGDSVLDPLGRLCLHATELGFTYPATGQSARFHSPAPEGFWKLVGKEPPPSPTSSSETVHSAPTSVTSVAEPAPALTAPRVATSWDHVAGWYERLIGENRSDHYRDVILPGALRLLRPAAGMRVLDVACGEGVLCRRLHSLNVEVVGIDASDRLIESARRGAGAHTNHAGPPPRFEVGDARALQSLNLGTFDAAACVMALMNIDPLEPVLRGVTSLLKPGGALVAVILHPAFRAPGQTSWGWDEGPNPRAREKEGTREPRQYRRVDGYLSTGQTPIVMNPGQAAAGKDAVTTWTFHRPIQTYVRLLTEAGFLLEALEEWPSLRKSQPGQRAREENRARREIPLFLGLRALKRG